MAKKNQLLKKTSPDCHLSEFTKLDFKSLRVRQTIYD